MPREYLDVAAIAELAGVKPATISRYAAGGDPTFPEPDITLSGRGGWLRETVDVWLASRPGQGSGGGRPRKDASAPPTPRPSSS
jgi:predicted DNA-binding transcriptional regulator AlpA